jgi:hypothetical protein
MFRVYVGKCLSRPFGPVRNHLGGKLFADDEHFETEVRKWMRQHSKYFFAAGFDAPINRWNKHINVGRGYAEK